MKHNNMDDNKMWNDRTNKDRKNVTVKAGIPTTGEAIYFKVAVLLLGIMLGFIPIAVYLSGFDVTGDNGGGKDKTMTTGLDNGCVCDLQFAPLCTNPGAYGMVITYWKGVDISGNRSSENAPKNKTWIHVVGTHNEQYEEGTNASMTALITAGSQFQAFFFEYRSISNLTSKEITYSLDKANATVQGVFYFAFSVSVNGAKAQKVVFIDNGKVLDNKPTTFKVPKGGSLNVSILAVLDENAHLKVSVLEQIPIVYEGIKDP